MITHISIRARVVLAVFALASIAVFTVLLGRFGGPQVGAGSTVYARFADAEGLSQNADVLVRGVPVGHVASIKTTRGGSTVALDLAHGAPALHRDASARIGSKTPLGESFVDLDPGTSAARSVGGDVRIATRPSVQIDDALSVLDRSGRASLRQVLSESATALRAPGASQQLSDTLAALDRATVALKALTGTVNGQGGQIASAVTSARALLREIGDHDASVRGIVRGGRSTITALAAADGAIGPSLDRAARIVHSATATLAAARPLIAQVRPFSSDVEAVAPHLSGALRALPKTASAADRLMTALPSVERSALPAFATARHDLPAIDSAVRALGPALRDTIPMLRYLAPRANTIAAWFSNTDALGQNGDVKGRWARFFVGFDPSSGFGLPRGPPGNSYTEPGDAAHSSGFRPGDFPHLMPFRP